MVIENPDRKTPLRKQRISEYNFNFSTNRTIGSFIDFAKETKSAKFLDYSHGPVCCDLPPPKPVFFEFRRGKYSKLYLIDFKYPEPEFSQLFNLLVEISKTEKIIKYSKSLIINVDSIYSNKSKHFKIKFETPPPPVQPTIKFIHPKEKK